MVPHVTNEIKERIKDVSRISGADVVIVDRRYVEDIRAAVPGSDTPDAK